MTVVGTIEAETPVNVTVMGKPELAAVLERIQKLGARDFYEGETARLIAEDMKANGGLISKEDLAAYEPKERVPLAQAVDASQRDDLVLSSNVLLRPVVERCILPTVAYVGAIERGDVAR